jgi:hypothetical protein
MSVPKHSATSLGAASEGYYDDSRLSVPRFADLDVRATGSFKPNEPITITVSARAIVATRSLDVGVMLPDYERAKRGNWTKVVARQRETVPVHAHWSRSLGAGERVEERTTVVIPVAGTYRVRLRVAADSSEPRVVNGEVVQNSAEKEIWLTIRSSGGRSAEHFPYSVANREPGRRVAHGARETAGPEVMSASLIDPCIDPTQPGCDPDPDPLPPDGFAGRVYYVNSILNGGSPGVATLGHALVVLLDPYTLKQIASTYTDASGYYRFDYCPSGGTYSYYVVGVYARNNYVFVNRGSANTDDLAGMDVWSQDCNTQVDIGVAYDYQAEAFDNMTSAAIASQNLFQHTADRGVVKVSANLNATSPTAYWSAPDTIALTSGHVIGQVAVFDAAHEYGHAVHAKALQSLPLTNCTVHSFNSDLNLQCAYGEGFADFHAIATRTSQTEPFYSRISQNFYFNDPANPGTEGSLREGVVAAFLFDLVDRVGTDTTTHASPSVFQDNISMSGSNLANLVKGCQSQQQNTATGTTSWVKADGVDHLVYCLENRWHTETRCYTLPGYPPYKCAGYYTVYVNDVDSWARDNYFGPRRWQGLLPVSWSMPTGSFAFPDFTSVRQLWLCDLYGQC